jgi:hypothetical protein
MSPGLSGSHACSRGPWEILSTPFRLAEPTGPALLSRAYLHMASPGRGVFQHPASPAETDLACTRPVSPAHLPPRLRH